VTGRARLLAARPHKEERRAELRKSAEDTASDRAGQTGGGRGYRGTGGTGEG
jgi:hypothetical protein